MNEEFLKEIEYLNWFDLTIKNCDEIEKFKAILVKSLKMRRRFDVRLTSLLSQ